MAVNMLSELAIPRLQFKLLSCCDRLNVKITYVITELVSGRIVSHDEKPFSIIVLLLP